ncbi:hypothetical protein JHK85_019150 [Glycine max]|nr:hypothetical protein JHK85_019150 [Glycine max]
MEKPSTARQGKRHLRQSVSEGGHKLSEGMMASEQLNTAKLGSETFFALSMSMSLYGNATVHSATAEFQTTRRGSESDEAAAAFLNTIIINHSSCTTPEEKKKPTRNTMQVS